MNCAMNYLKGRCSQCGREVAIVNRTRMLCASCNYKRLHEGRSRVEVRRQRGGKSDGKRHTGEKGLFLKIWSQRPHYCVKCGKWLGDEPKAVFFSHIKSKGAHPELRLDPNNIELLCSDCHYRHEFGKRNV